MSIKKAAIEYVFVWHSMVDARSCKKCVALNGRQYHGQDLFASVLVDPAFGPVWSLDGDFSLVHGGAPTCRCRLEVKVESVDLSSVKELASLNRFLEGHF